MVSVPWKPGLIHRLPILALAAPATLSVSAILLSSSEDAILQANETSVAATSLEKARYTVSGEGVCLKKYHGAPMNAKLLQEEDRSQHETAELLEYWVKPAEPVEKKAASNTESPGYITFETDIGGLNNIRLLFEYIVDVASKSNRTLVLPPSEGWYLIDWGATNSHDQRDEKRLPEGKDHTWSTYPEFFDVKSLSEKMPVITAAEFFQRERDRFNIPDEVDPERAGLVNSPDMNGWKAWLRRSGTWPRMSGDEEGGCDDLRDLIASDKAVIHVPCSSVYSGDNSAARLRFFDCGRPLNSELLHFNPWFFDVASGPVSQLKFGKYAALHLRRNEFQYAQAPSAEGSRSLLQDMETHLEPGEPVYIASDEIDSAWWDGFRDALDKSGHRMVSAKDFQADMAAKGVTHRHLPIVEMIVCSGARVFLGTQGSTFTTGIQEMREKIAHNNEKRLLGGSELLELAQDLRGDVQHYHAEKLFIHI
eukprot:TRINITY_DN90168_c0_g1_i1.p1 TRINITY_DN90168_c0_g1~~TRINITY_DN90168_c0_g1_i1.p1  ORF type:complete len:501 (+),score=110.43 TRINITY_DN90168_c0_g1_i1:69-1505(+)